MKDIEFKEEQRKEALERLKDLTKTFDLDNKLIEDFKIGKINCMLDKKLCDIKDYPKLERLIKKFEQEYNTVAYHCFLTKHWDMEMLSVLYISPYKEDWEVDRLFLDSYNKCYYIASFVYNLDIPNCSEFGEIIISNENGLLTRIG